MKWEYKIVEWYEESEKNEQRFLNRLGADGWELVHMTNFQFYFKRPAEVKNIHGVNCPKVPHIGGSHDHHAQRDDAFIDGNGMRCCGRCHDFLGDAEEEGA